MADGQTTPPVQGGGMGGGGGGGNSTDLLMKLLTSGAISPQAAPQVAQIANAGRQADMLKQTGRMLEQQAGMGMQGLMPQVPGGRPGAPPMPSAFGAPGAAANPGMASVLGPLQGPQNLQGLIPGQGRLV